MSAVDAIALGLVNCFWGVIVLFDSAVQAQSRSFAVATPLEHLEVFEILWTQKSRTLLLKTGCLKLKVL